MGTVTVTTERVLDGEAMLYTWTLTNAGGGDVGVAVTAHEFGDRTCQIAGTFDSATVVLQGSNDGTNWFTLTDPQGNSISATSAKLEQVMETPRFTRPSSSGGSGSQAVVVSMFCRRTRR